MGIASPAVGSASRECGVHVVIGTGPAGCATARALLAQGIPVRMGKPRRAAPRTGSARRTCGGGRRGRSRRTASGSLRSGGPVPVR